MENNGNLTQHEIEVVECFMSENMRIPEHLIEKMNSPKVLRLTDYSYNKHIDTPWNGRSDFTLHDSEDWKGGLLVTVYMKGVHFFSEIFCEKRRVCDVIVKSVDTGKLYYTDSRFLSENLIKDRQNYESMNHGWYYR